MLDLSGSTARWHRVVVPNSGPGPRYAHVLALVAQRYLVALGGNDGRQALDDVWALDTAAKPYQWQHINPEGESPVARMYATASARADGLLLLCGGREASNSPVVRNPPCKPFEAERESERFLIGTIIITFTLSTSVVDWFHMLIATTTTAYQHASTAREP